MTRRSFNALCTIEVEHTNEHFHAHVVLDGDVAIYPGDRVQVHGAAIQVPFGGRLVERRPATVIRANWIERLWVRLRALFEVTELYEISFSTWRAR
jgi:hypothetical protein